MASDNAFTDSADPDSRQTYPSCSLLHDRHTVCIAGRGGDCTFDKRCEVCSSWDDFMYLYLYTLAVSPSLGGSRQHRTDNKTNGDFTPFFWQ